MNRGARCVVAVDVGTSAIRAAAVDAEGAIRGRARVERPAGSGERFDAERLCTDVASALAALPRSPVSALVVSAHLGVVAVDERLRPVDEAGGWSDPRGLDELRAVDPGLRDALLRAARRPVITGGALARALALRRDPAVASRVRHLLSPKDFLVARLTGRVGTDPVHAAYTLLADVPGRTWNVPAVEALGIDPRWLPEQVRAADVLGEVHREATARCALPAGTPVLAGGPDGSIGIGLLLGSHVGGIADVAGTTDVVGRLLDDPSALPSALLNPALLGDRWVAGGATGMTGGAVAGWRELVGPVADEDVAAVPPGADGLRVLPATTGSRFPRWRPEDRGALLGQEPAHSAAHLVRAAQEGAAFAVREGVDLLDPPESGRLPVLLAGGLTRSPVATRLRADVLGRPVLVCAEPDVTLLGAAAVGLVGTGATADLDEARSLLGCELRRVEPDPVRARRYEELFAGWLADREGTPS
ncbi:xylulokinase [Saccharopolyspora gregorii]|uniref:FGGY-family carbohydrate kinase n=1 Tax=Saccharopolyspora gregorii TaxID=33914 RepID=A0ABP6RVB1_9PSEU